MSKINIDLSGLDEWMSLDSGTHLIQVKAKASKSSGYADSDVSKAVSVTKTTSMLTKGSIINMSLGNTTPEAGIQNQYRILSINGTIAEVVAMYDQVMSLEFSDESGSTDIYANGILDKYLNSTFYESLNESAKSAIVRKTFKQDSWYNSKKGSPIYSGYYGTTNPGTIGYFLSSASSSYGSSITRYVYALSVQDIIDYVTDIKVDDGEIQNYNIWKMLWNTTDQPSVKTDPWLRSASVGEYYKFASYVDGGFGSMSYSITNSANSVRPAFTIDLSKINWEKIE